MRNAQCAINTQCAMNAQCAMKEVGEWSSRILPRPSSTELRLVLLLTGQVEKQPDHAAFWMGPQPSPDEMAETFGADRCVIL
eukprot:21807-Pelagomonas_calceolata.AAC.1